MPRLCLVPLLLVGAFWAESRVRAADQPLNILWLIAEDLSPDLGCYGAEQVWTPNIDRLARRGMRYTKAFTTAPVCSASRSAACTGMYQTSIGAHNHRSHRTDGYELPEGVRTICDRFRDAGYFTANCRTVGGEHLGSGKTDWNFNAPTPLFDSDNFGDLKRHQPFYAQVNFAEAHRGPAWNTAHERIERTAAPGKVMVPPYYPDHPLTRNDWAQYLNAVMALDAKVGRVLARLASDGMADNTVVVFMGDHGQAHVRGKQWCYDSGLHVPLIIVWPESASPPPHYKAGSVSDQLISAIDVTATSLAMAGIEKPPAMQGRVFLGSDAEPPRQCVFAARDRCDETVFRIRTARDARYRYIRNFDPEKPFLQPNAYKERQYPVIALLRQLDAEGRLTPEQQVLMAPTRAAEELYDLEDDPHEVRNLAESSNSAHQKALSRLRSELDRWIVESGDQGQYPEPAEVLAAAQEAASAAPRGRSNKKRDVRGTSADGKRRTGVD